MHILGNPIGRCNSFSMRQTGGAGGKPVTRSFDQRFRRSVGIKSRSFSVRFRIALRINPGGDKEVPDRFFKRFLIQ